MVIKSSSSAVDTNHRNGPVTALALVLFFCVLSFWSIICSIVILDFCIEFPFIPYHPPHLLIPFHLEIVTFIEPHTAHHCYYSSLYIVYAKPISLFICGFGFLFYFILNKEKSTFFYLSLIHWSSCFDWVYAGLSGNCDFFFFFLKKRVTVDSCKKRS